MAEIFNKWYNAKFTTDAFYYCVQNAYYGMNATYTEVIDKLRATPGYVGIFEIEITPFSSAHPTVLIKEHNIVDGRDRFVKHEVRSKTNHQKVEITEAEYKEIMGVK